MTREQLERLLEKVEEALRFDVNQIYQEAARGKLSATSSRDLVAYLKHLADERSRDVDPSALGDTELEKLVEKALKIKEKK
jgi:hypothetical protein